MWLSKNKTVISLLTMLIILSSVYLFWTKIANQGLGIRTDSVRYMWIAENIANGKGFGRTTGTGDIKVEFHWPPLYSILLAGLQKVGLPISYAQHFIAIVSFLVIGICVFSLSHTYFPYGLLLLLFLQYSPLLWSTGLYAMTELPYISFMLAGTVFLLKYVSSRKTWHLLLSAGFFALSTLTRYVGIVPVFTSAFLLFLYCKEARLKKRIASVGIFLVVSLAGLFLWLLAGYLYNHGVGNRNLAYNPISPEEWQLTKEFVGGVLHHQFWSRISGVRIGAIALLFPYILIYHYRVITSERLKSFIEPKRITFLMQFMALHTVVYVIFILMSKLYFDPFIPLYEERIWAPAFISASFLVFGIFYNLLVRATRFWSYPSALGLAIIVLYFALLVGIKPTAQQTDSLYSHGLGLATISSEDLPLTPVLQKYRQETNQGQRDIYITDNIDFMYYYYHQPALQITSENASKVQQLCAQYSRCFIVLFQTYSPDNTIREYLSGFIKVFSEEPYSIYVSEKSAVSP